MIQIQPRLFLVILDVPILELRPIVLNSDIENYTRSGEI